MSRSLQHARTFTYTRYTRFHENHTITDALNLFPSLTDVRARTHTHPHTLYIHTHAYTTVHCQPYTCKRSVNIQSHKNRQSSGTKVTWSLVTTKRKSPTHQNYHTNQLNRGHVRMIIMTNNKKRKLMKKRQKL